MKLVVLNGVKSPRRSSVAVTLRSSCSFSLRVGVGGFPTEKPRT